LEEGRGGEDLQFSRDDLSPRKQATTHSEGTKNASKKVFILLKKKAQNIGMGSHTEEFTKKWSGEGWLQESLALTLSRGGIIVNPPHHPHQIVIEGEGEQAQEVNWG
jgi:hypothetical protein